MATPLYQGAELLTRPKSGHHGLWHERFFNGYAVDWTLDNTDKTAKKAWLERIADRSGVGDKAQIESAADPEATKREIRARLERLRSPFRSAERFYVEEIVPPAETRRWLCEFAGLAGRVPAAAPRGFHYRP